MIGTSIRLVRVLGEGGMGSVWVADHLTLQTQVAVKFMSQSLMASEDAVIRFSREATAAAQVKSPHVVQMFDHGLTPEGIPYIVMELLEGEDLGKRLAAVGRLSLAETTDIVVQVCKALAKAHRFGIVHRDIKPENIFLTDADGDIVVKVLDFGIAKTQVASTAAVTSSGVTVGTPYYMSPEQVVSAKAVDHRSDLWSLGVVAYHCLTAARPFDGETLGALMIAIDRGIFMPPSHGAPELGPTLDAWMSRALRRDAAGRFTSAKEMADSLVQVRQGAAATLASSGQRPTPEPIAAAPRLHAAVGSASIAGATVSTHMSARRGGAFAAVVAAMVATAAAIGAAAYLLQSRHPTSAGSDTTMEQPSEPSEPSEPSVARAEAEPPPSQPVDSAPPAAGAPAASSAAPAPSASAVASVPAKRATNVAAPQRSTAAPAPKAPATAKPRPTPDVDHGF
jgi:serine/threonine-protein kinase